MESALNADTPCLRAVSMYDMMSRYCCRHLVERKHPETFVLVFTNLNALSARLLSKSTVKSESRSDSTARRRGYSSPETESPRPCYSGHWTASEWISATRSHTPDADSWQPYVYSPPQRELCGDQAFMPVLNLRLYGSIGAFMASLRTSIPQQVFVPSPIRGSKFHTCWKRGDDPFASAC